MVAGKTQSRALLQRLQDPPVQYDRSVFRQWLRILENARVIDPTTSLSEIEDLADQAGAGAALTFTFSADVQVMYVVCRGGDGRASISSTPTSSTGMKCPDGAVVPIPVLGSTVKVYAGMGITVSVWGAR